MWKQFKTELYKICRQPLFGCFLVMPVLLLIYEISFPERLVVRANAFKDFFNLSYSEGVYCYLMGKISMFNLILLIMVCFQYVRIEQKNNCRNALFTLPVKAGTIYWAKMGVLLVSVLLNNLLIFALLSCSVFLFDTVEIPSVIHFLYYSAGCIMLACFHYTLAGCTRNLMLYLLVFIALFAASFLIKSNGWIPYSYSNGFLVGYYTKVSSDFYLVKSFMGAILFVFLGYLTFKRTQLWQR